MLPSLSPSEFDHRRTPPTPVHHRSRPCLSETYDHSAVSAVAPPRSPHNAEQGILRIIRIERTPQILRGRTGEAHRFRMLPFGLIAFPPRLTDRPSLACRQLRTSCPQPFGPDVVPRRACVRHPPAMVFAFPVAGECAQTG